MKSSNNRPTSLSAKAVALLALVLLPVVWLLSLPLRLIGITVSAAFALIRAILFLPARLLGGKRCGCA